MCLTGKETTQKNKTASQLKDTKLQSLKDTKLVRNMSITLSPKILATSPSGFTTDFARLSKTGAMESVYAGQLEEGDMLLKMRAKERLVREEVVAMSSDSLFIGQCPR